MLLKWSNGSKGGVVKDIIEHNFKTLSKNLNKTMLALSEEEIKILPTDYYTVGTRVFNTTTQKYNDYDGTKWIESFDNAYVYAFTSENWVNGVITIPFDTHCIKNPIIQVFMFHSGKYIPIVGCEEIDLLYNITLSSDLNFDGKVVIK